MLVGDDQRRYDRPSQSYQNYRSSLFRLFASFGEVPYIVQDTYMKHIVNWALDEFVKTFDAAARGDKEMMRCYGLTPQYLAKGKEPK